MAVYNGGMHPSVPRSLRAGFFALLCCVAFVPQLALASAFTKPMNNLGLVGYWPFEDVSGGGNTQITDFSGNGNTGTLIGSPVWTDGKVGKALFFDTAGDYVTVPNSTSINLNTAQTLSFWIKDTESTKSYADYLKKTNFTNAGWRLVRTGATVDMTATVFTSGGATNFSVTGVLDGNWHHVVYTLNSGTAALYKDGVWVDGGAYAAGSGFADPADQLSMSDGAPPANYLDEVRLYNRALSASEVTSLYQAGGAKFKNPNNLGLVGYWSFNEGSGTRAEDYSGNGNYGTTTGSGGTNNKPQWVDGARAYALDFDMTDDEVDLGSPSNTDNLTTKTVCAWIKPRSYGEFNSNGHYGEIMSKIDSDGWAFELNDGWTVQPGVNALGFYQGYPGFNAGYWHTSTSSIQLNKWQHVCASYDNSAYANIPVMYINGTTTQVEAFTNGQPTGGSPANDAAAELRIGNCCDTAQTFDGAIDEVRIYNRILTAAEVAKLYASGLTRINTSQNRKMTDGLIGLWSFNGPDVTWGTSNTVLDGSGNGNTGHLDNMATRTSMAEGKVGQAALLDGVDDYVSVPSLLGSPANITLMGWVNLIAPDPVAGTTIISLGDRVFLDIEINATDANGVVGTFYNGSAWVKTSATSSSFAGKGWHHFAYTFDDTNNVQKIYVDGIASSTSAFSQSITYAGGVGTRMGREGDDNTRKDLNGRLDEVRVYNRALTAAEIYRIYRLGR